MTFGYYDKEKYTGDLKWHDVKYKYLFGVQLDDIKINGKNMKVCEGIKECLITFDTGSSYMALPSIAYNNLNQKGVPTELNYVPCNDSKEFGNFVFIIGG